MSGGMGGPGCVSSTTPAASPFINRLARQCVVHGMALGAAYPLFPTTCMKRRDSFQISRLYLRVRSTCTSTRSGTLLIGRRSRESWTTCPTNNSENRSMNWRRRISTMKTKGWGGRRPGVARRAVSRPPLREQLKPLVLTHRQLRAQLLHRLQDHRHHNKHPRTPNSKRSKPKRLLNDLRKNGNTPKEKRADQSNSVNDA